MKQILIKTLLLALLAGANFACKDDLIYSDLVQDRRPAVPVTFPNATTFGANPFIIVSAATGIVKFDLSIPASSGRTIKEITTVVGGGTGINAGSLNTASLKFNTAPLAGSGTTVTFQTTIADFSKKYAAVNVAPVADPLSPREIAFIFLVTLDNGDQIVTQQVRARIIP